MVACGLVAAAMRASGYEVPEGLRCEGLSAWQLVVVQHLARRIAAPDGRDAPSPDDAGVAAFVDGYVARAPAAMRRDLGRFLAFIEHIAPLGAGFVARFSRLGAHEQDRVLESLESSSNDLLRAGFDGIKALVFMGYYRDPRTFRILGYDGPRVAGDAGRARNGGS